MPGDMLLCEAKLVQSMPTNHTITTLDSFDTPKKTAPPSITPVPAMGLMGPPASKQPKSKVLTETNNDYDTKKPIKRDAGAALNPSRFIFGSVSAAAQAVIGGGANVLTNSLSATLDIGTGGEMDSGSDRDMTPRSGSTTPRDLTPRSRGSSKVDEEVEDTEVAVVRVCQNLARLKLYVSSIAEKIPPLTTQIDALELRKQEIKTRDDLSLLHRIEAVQNYLKAARSILSTEIEKKMFDDRERQMNEFFELIPIAEKNQRSLVDSWNAMFDVHAIVPRALAKDFCDTCRRPLLLIRKQAQLQCTHCARMTEHLMPVSHANAWMKTNINTQPENKRIKAVLAKLNQFLVGSPPVPSEITLGVRQALKSRSHVSAESVALPAAVAAALASLGHEKYVPYSAKICAIVNGFVTYELTSEQINEIVSRLRISQFVHNILSSTGKLSSRQFYTHYVVSQISVIMQLPWLSAVFPVQKSKRQLREQTVSYKQLLHYLRQIDTTHTWP